MSFNSSGKEGAVHKIREHLFAEFADRYFPAQTPQTANAPDATADAQLVTGRYASSRRAESSFFKLFTLLGQSKVMSKDEGVLAVPGLDGLNGQPRDYRAVAPFLWRNSATQDQLGAKVDGQRVQMLSTDEIGGILVFLPVPWQQSGAWIVPTILVASVILLLTTLAWPIAAWRRRRRSTPLALSPRELSIYRFARVVAVIDVIFLVGWMFLVSAGNADLAAYDGHLDLWFYVLHFLGIVGAVGAIVALWNGWLAIAGKRGWKATTWNVALGLSCLAVSWFGFAFNLIQFGLRY
jgi:hypothetical protein